MRGAILRRPSSGAVVAQRYGVVQWQASAVGIDRLAGDVGRVVACEKHGDGRDLLRIAETAERRSRQDGAPPARRHPRHGC